MNCDMECVECHTCGCEYNVFQNNEYGYLNCCNNCGENRYEEEQEQKKPETPYLPENIFSLILKIRGNEMKNDKYKKNFNKCIEDIQFIGDQIIEVDLTDPQDRITCVMLDYIYELKIEEAKEDALDKYLESQEPDYSTHPSLLALS